MSADAAGPDVIACAVMSPKFLFFAIALAIGLPTDQLTKQWIIANVHYGERIEIIPGFFNLTHVRNPGGAFSFFASGPVEVRMAFFIGSTLLALVLLLVFLRQHPPETRLAPLALGMIMGGALGNLIDRLRYGEVIDFLDVHLWGGYTWPTFNVADSAIVVGVVILMVEIFFFQEQAPSEELAGDST
jgi:signal peptidase II